MGTLTIGQSGDEVVVHAQGVRGVLAPLRVCLQTQPPTSQGAGSSTDARSPGPYRCRHAPLMPWSAQPSNGARAAAGPVTLAGRTVRTSASAPAQITGRRQFEGRELSKANRHAHPVPCSAQLSNPLAKAPGQGHPVMHAGPGGPCARTHRLQAPLPAACRAPGHACWPWRALHTPSRADRTFASSMSSS